MMIYVVICTFNYIRFDINCVFSWVFCFIKFLRGASGAFLNMIFWKISCLKVVHGAKIDKVSPFSFVFCSR